MSSLIKADESYRKWIEEVSRRFRSSQIKAAVKVNDEMLRFYLDGIYLYCFKKPNMVLAFTKM